MTAFANVRMCNAKRTGHCCHAIRCIHILCGRATLRALKLEESAVVCLNMHGLEWTRDRTN